MRAKCNVQKYTGARWQSRRERCRKIYLMKNLANENGSAIVIALMLLSLLTVMGIWSTRKSNIETLIAGNEVARKQTFFRTESGVIEGGFSIEEAATGVTEVAEANDEQATNVEEVMATVEDVRDQTREVESATETRSRATPRARWPGRGWRRSRPCTPRPPPPRVR